MTKLHAPHVGAFAGWPDRRGPGRSGQAATALLPDEVNRLLGGTDYFGGSNVSVADLHLLPVLTYLQATPEGQALMTATPNIGAWMARMNQRSSVRAVMPSA